MRKKAYSHVSREIFVMSVEEKQKAKDEGMNVRIVFLLFPGKTRFRLILFFLILIA